MDGIKRLLLNPFVISAVLCSIIYLFLPDLFLKYEFKLIDQYAQNRVLEYRHDIDHDSVTELIRLGYNYENNDDSPFLIVSEIDPKTGAQYTKSQNNFNTAWIEHPGMCFGNYDKNQMVEIYFFTHKDDSLFLLGFDPLNEKGFFLNRFISKVTFVEDNPDFRIFFGGVYNITKDDFGDILFTISSWYSMEPRAVFVFDIRNDTLLISETQDACFLNKPKVAYDKEFGPVIYSDSYAPSNQKKGRRASYADSNAWFMLFDRNLELLFPPIKFGSFTSGVYVTHLSYDSSISLLARFGQADVYGINYLARYDLSGNLIRKRVMNDDLRSSYHAIAEKSNYSICLKTKDKILRLNQNLETKREFKNDFPGSILQALDIDSDEENEIINFNSQNGKLTILRNNFTHPVSVYLQDDISQSHISKTYFYDSDINLMIHANDKSYYLCYLQNELYYYQYLIYLGIYLIISIFFYLLLKFQKSYLQSKHEQEMKVNELVLLTIKNQIEPHFTFNVINSISSMIYEEDRKKAYQFLLEFSKLIRASLTNARKIEIKLSDELDFVERYLNLEQIRFKNNFEFEINVSPEVNKNQFIPRMIIHTFVENAIKHGLAQKSSAGFLKITSENISNNLRIAIEDNGIGRARAKDESTGSTGKGLKIIEQITDLYKKIHNSTVSYTFEDLYDENKLAIGTKVIINIPESDTRKRYNKSNNS